jgi:N-acetyl-anhydromuramyl-L-alanine amidase AmpD
MNRVVHHTEAEARDFFERLATYAAEYVRIAIPQVHRHWPSGNCYEEWRFDHPIGNVLHYTAGVSFAGTIRHFVLGSRASSNWVVAKALDARFDRIRADLGLDAALRAECVQVVPPTLPAWHAGWMNRLTTGIEVRNAGVLRAYPKDRGEPGQRSMTRNAFFEYAGRDVDDLDFFWWGEGWTKRFEGEVLEVNGSWWESWSRGSIATVIALLRYLNALHPGRLDPVHLLAHHQVAAAKNDVVLPVDLDLIRTAVLFDDRHVDDLEWLAEYDDCEDGFEDVDDPWMLRESDERQSDRAEEDLDGFEPGARISGADLPDWAIEALRRFGFFVGHSNGTNVEVDEEAVRRSTRIYQRGRNLTVDGVLGPATAAALDRDLRTWRLRR